MVTQSPGQGLSPVNAVSDGDDKHLILFGHDVVSYFTDGRHQMGSPAHKSVHKGVTFRFASAEHKKLFDAAPEKYIPQFGGYCANGIVYGIPWGGDADTWRIIDGKLYIFGGAGSRDAFLLDPKANLALAEKYWKRGGRRLERVLAALEAARPARAALQERRGARRDVARAKGGK